MLRRPPISTRTDPLFPYTTLFRSTSARARVVVYNTERLSEDDLPDSILDFTDPEWSGRLGWAPTNGSFQAFVTALRVLEGEDGARAWLEGIQANNPAVFDGRSEEHTSELQSLMRISYAVFCLKKKTNNNTNIDYNRKVQDHTDQPNA